MKFVEISVSFLFINVKSSNFSFGFNLIVSSIESSFDFVDFKKFSTVFKVMLESVKHSVDFIMKSTS